jgi:hypothetical protein
MMEHKRQKSNENKRQIDGVQVAKVKLIVPEACNYDAPFVSLPLADFEIPWRHLVSVCVTNGMGMLQHQPPCSVVYGVV